MLQERSEYSSDGTLDAVLEIAADGAKHDEWGYRKEFLEIVGRAKELTK